MKFTTYCISALLTAFFNVFLLKGELNLSKIFSDNMVLQRNVEIPVWGTSNPNEGLVICFAGHNLTVTADKNGNWKIELPELTHGGPYQMVIYGKSDSIILNNILIGDVWFASGQSNMEHAMNGWEWIPNSEIINLEQEINDTNSPMIRLFTVDKFPSPIPLRNLQSGHWDVASPKTVYSFSATAWFFAKKLYEHTKIPIGIIHSSWGGTSINSWLSKESLQTFKDSLNLSNELIETNNNLWTKEVESSLQRNRIYRNTISYPPVSFVEKISKKYYNDIDWGSIQNLLDSYNRFKKISWLRKEFYIEREPSGEELILSLGFIDRQSNVYINGQEIGYFQYPGPVEKEISDKILNKGENIIVVRMAQPFSNSKIVGEKNKFFIKDKDGRFYVDLFSDWKYNNEIEDAPEPALSYQHTPSFLFNGMVAPIIFYPIKGIIWNQGASDIARPYLYEKQFKELIKDWRSKWNLGDIPFLYVQAANAYESHDSTKFTNRKPLLREAQRKALDLPNTGMVVSYDIGDPYDVHPKNKKDFGYRLALQALKVAYHHKDVIANGPIIKKITVKNNLVIIDLNDKIYASEDLLYNGFELAHEDAIFCPAKISIKDTRVYVISENIQNPIYIRYNWLDNPKIFLRNKEGLPMGPFKMKLIDT